MSVETRQVTGIGRRTMMMSGAVLSLMAAGGRARAAANIIDVTAAPYNASVNSPDNTQAFQAALNTLLSLGGGVLQVPPGMFVLAGQLNYPASSGSLTIMGYGSGASVLVIRHPGTGLSVSFTSPGSAEFVLHDIGFSPAATSGVPGTAVALTMSAAPSAWPSCRIDNVDFGATYPNYTVFTNALLLTNVTRSKITNCNAHSNSHNGGAFLTLAGFCVDNQVSNCTIDGYNYGVNVSAYSQGLHITNTVFIGNTAVTTGGSNYNDGVNLLGLYISGCEFNCQSTILWLYQVNSGWISDTNLYGPRAGVSNVACALIGCGRIKIAKCLFSGFFNPAAPTNQIAIQTVSSSAVPSYAITVDDCSFENTLVAVVLGGGTLNVTSMQMRLFGPGLATLVNDPVPFGTLMMQPVIDNSGNLSNTGAWISSVNAVNHKISARTVFSR